jgi:hypothetical protein
MNVYMTLTNLRLVILSVKMGEMTEIEHKQHGRTVYIMVDLLLIRFQKNRVTANLIKVKTIQRTLHTEVSITLTRLKLMSWVSSLRVGLTLYDTLGIISKIP